MTDESLHTETGTAHTPEEEYLDWLNPVMRADYIACEVDGKSGVQRAEERGVTRETVYANVSRARQRLKEIYEEQEEVE